MGVHNVDTDTYITLQPKINEIIKLYDLGFSVKKAIEIVRMASKKELLNEISRRD